MDRKNTLVSMENDKNKEELHITTALKNCGYPNWIFDKVKEVHEENEKDNFRPRTRWTGSYSLCGRVVEGYREEL